MSARPRNTAASIYGRLTNQARKTSRPFGEVLQYYGMERFLYRLSKTEYADRLILKGGLLFYIWGLPLRRPTKDIDFLGLLDNRVTVWRQVIAAAISVPDPADGLVFDISTMTIEESQTDADRNGLRIKLTALLARTHIPIQIDVGFSDEIHDLPPPTRYPTLLGDMLYPVLRGYPPESVVAEKFHAMERFADTPSRWKDYYDLWLISDQLEFAESSLQRALQTTFARRKTTLPTDRPGSLSVELARTNQKNWENFLQKSGVSNSEIKDLTTVVDRIWAFLAGPLHHVDRDGVSSSDGRWLPKQRKWL